jgi:hypothetical protein
VGDEGIEGKLKVSMIERNLFVYKLGKKGLTGAKGETGQKGKRGPIGLKGENGLEGDIGPIGEQGAKGKIGPQGIAGKKGVCILSINEIWFDFVLCDIFVGYGN